MQSRLSVGKLAGISVYVHWTFSLLLVYVVFTSIRGGAGPVGVLWTLLFVLSMFACVVLHELGHALAARRYGIATRDITLLPIGGVASLESMPEKPSEELVVAIAGPLVNVAIALLLLPLVHGVTPAAEVEQLSRIEGSNFLLTLLSVNVTLVIFNLLPAFPMDGGRVLRALLSMKMERARATRAAATVGQVCAVGFVILGFVSNPMLVLIGIFIFLGAQGEASYAETKSMLAGYRVRDVLLREFGTLNADDTIAQAVQALLSGQSRSFLVLAEGAPVGVLTREAIIAALSESGDGTPVGAAMDRELVTLDANMPLEEAFQTMQQRRKDLMPVMDGGQLVGALDPENVVELVMVVSARAR